MDRKEGRSESVWIYVYSYRRADPECANPSGSVNFSARLEIGVNGFMSDLSTPSTTDDDVFCRRGRICGRVQYYCKMYYTTGSTRRINADGSRCRGVCVRLFVRCTVCSAQTHLARPFVREIQNSPPNKTSKRTRAKSVIAQHVRRCRRQARVAVFRIAYMYMGM